MELVSFQVNVLFQEYIASPPWGRRERGLFVMNKSNRPVQGLVKYPCDLTPIVTINRRVRLPLSQGRGHSLTSFLADGVLGFQDRVLFEDGFGFSPFGETGEGFVRCTIFMPQLAQRYLACILKSYRAY